MKFGRLSNLVENRIKLSTMAIMRFSFTDRGVQELVIALNSESQLFNDGVDASGNPVGDYSQYTEMMYKGLSFRGRQKIAGEPYFFFDTGAMFDSFFIRVNNDSITIGNTDIEKLNDNRNIANVADLLGLTEESQDIVIDEILPEMREYILKTLLK